MQSSLFIQVVAGLVMAIPLCLWWRDFQTFIEDEHRYSPSAQFYLWMRGICTLGLLLIACFLL